MKTIRVGVGIANGGVNYKKWVIR